MDATASARGAKIVADMRTIQSAEMIYYAKYAKYPATGTGDANFTALVQGGWPTPPSGSFTIARVLDGTNGGATEGNTATAYTYTNADTTGETPGSVNLTATITKPTGITNPTLTQLLGGTTN